MSWWKDLRYSIRTMAKSPGFSLFTIAILGLSIGANTAIFSLIDAVMLRAIPVRDSNEILLLQWRARKAPEIKHYSSFGDCREKMTAEGASGCSFPLAALERIESESEVFESAAGFAGPTRLQFRDHGKASMVNGTIVSGSFFETLRVMPVMGRVLEPSDDVPSALPAVVLNYSFCEREFVCDPSIVGRSIFLNRTEFTVVGVIEPTLASISPGKSQDLWLPVSMLPRLNSFTWTQDIRRLDNWWLVIIARLKPGTRMARAQSGVTLAIQNEMLSESGVLSKSKNFEIQLTPVRDGLTGRRSLYSADLYVLMSAAGILLLLATANVGGLAVSRAMARQKEIAVRLALGAKRRWLWRQFLSESMSLSVIGGLLGIAVAYVGVHLIAPLLSNNLDRPFPFAVRVDWRVLLFMITTSILTGMLYGLAPAIRVTRADPMSILKENALNPQVGTPGTGRSMPVGKMLIVGQFALSFIVLIGAVLIIQTLKNLRNIDPGFGTDNILLFDVDLAPLGYSDLQVNDVYRQIQARLSELPGIQSTTYSSSALLSNGLWTGSISLETEQQDSVITVDLFAIGPDFLNTLRIPLLQGRTLVEPDFKDPSQNSAQPHSDNLEATVPVLVNEAFVKQNLKFRTPIGTTIRSGRGDESTGGSGTTHPGSRVWEIVGVVGDTRYSNLRRAIRPMIYMPLTNGAACFELRTKVAPLTFVPIIGRAISQVSPDVVPYRLRTETNQIDSLLSPETLLARIAGFVGCFALILVCVGLYGLLSYEVTIRTPEIGMRMALGARKKTILTMIVRQGVMLALSGVVIGAAGSMLIDRYLKSILYGINSNDIALFLLVTLLLVILASVSSYLPTRRILSMDPLDMLRNN